MASLVAESKEHPVTNDVNPKEARHRVLLLPGLLCTHFIYHHVIEDPKLKESNVYLEAADPPGFADHEADEGFDFAIPSYAKWLSDRASQIECDLVVGHSFFANVLVEAIRQGRYSGKTILLSPSLDWKAEDGLSRFLYYVLKFPAILHVANVSDFIVWMVKHCFLRSILKDYFAKETLARMPHILEDVVKMARGTSPRLGRVLYLSFFDSIPWKGTLAGNLQHARSPVLFVRGESDSMRFNPVTGDGLEQCCPNVLIVPPIKDVGHFVMLEKPEVFRDLLLDFLDNPSPRVSATAQ